MQVPIIAGVEHPHRVDMSEPIKCAVVVKPTRAARHKKEMLRYLVLVDRAFGGVALDCDRVVLHAREFRHH